MWHVYGRYEARVLVDDQEWGFSTGETKREAKRRSTEVALDNLTRYSEVSRIHE